MNDPSDKVDAVDLIRRIADQDREAFSRFYDLYSSLAFTFALRILRVRADAEDLLQEVFMQIWNKASQYNAGRGKPEAWVITITKSRAIDKLRSQRRKDSKGTVLEDQFLTMSRDAEHKQGIQSEVKLTMEGALGELSETQRQALELAYFEGLTHLEIAQKLEIPMGTAKTRIRDGLKKLREVLKTRKSGVEL